MTQGSVELSDPIEAAIQTDIINGLNKIIPANGDYQHSEGNSDAHIKSTFNNTEEFASK